MMRNTIWIALLCDATVVLALWFLTTFALIHPSTIINQSVGTLNNILLVIGVALVASDR